MSGCDDHLKQAFEILNRAQTPPARMCYYTKNDDSDAFVIVTECMDLKEVVKAYKGAIAAEEELSVKAAHHEEGGQYMDDESFVQLLLTEMRKIDPYAEVYWPDELPED
jgi:hypothetical protein